MDDDLTRSVCRAVEEFEQDYGRGRLWPLDVLVRHAREKVADLNPIADPALGVVVALDWLGPRGDGIPPRPLRDQLLAIIERHVPAERDRFDRLLEFAIAYGCGMWRQVEEGYGTWRQRWWGAIDELARRAILPAVRDAHHTFLAPLLPAFEQRGDEDLEDDARRLVMTLIMPTCKPLQEQGTSRMRIACDPDGAMIDFMGTSLAQVPAGAKYVFELAGPAVLHTRGSMIPWVVGTKVIVKVRDENTWVEATGLRRVTLNHWETADGTIPPGDLVVWECTCGHFDCHRSHRLERWDAADPGVKLWSFVASAVKGPLPRIRTGSFPQGMYFPMLAREGF
jgi:hypothetical protein